MKKVITFLFWLISVNVVFAQHVLNGYNSADAVAPAVSKLITALHNEHARVELDKVKEKKRDDMKLMYLSQSTDLERIMKLPTKMLAEVNKFVQTSISASAAEVLDTEGVVSFFMKGDRDTKDRHILYLFLNGKCVGLGSSQLGLVTMLPYESSAPDDFHEVQILCSDAGERPVLKELFKASVMFKLKSCYVIEPIYKKDVLTGINLL